jgi:hypothetical protein
MVIHEIFKTSERRAYAQCFTIGGRRINNGVGGFRTAV